MELQSGIYKASGGVLERLRELTPELTRLPDLVVRMDGHEVEYATPNGGECTGTAIFNDGTFAIQKSFMSKGTVLPAHAHPDCSEYIILLSGSLIVTFASGIQTGAWLKMISANMMRARSSTVHAGDVIAFLDGEKHQITAIDDTWMIAITIPAGEGYPK